VLEEKSERSSLLARMLGRSSRSEPSDAFEDAPISTDGHEDATLEELPGEVVL
jgi:hypothetical protein